MPETPKCYSCSKVANRQVHWMGHDGTTMDIPQCPDHGLFESINYFYDPIKDIDYQIHLLIFEKNKIEQRLEILANQRAALFDAKDNTPDGDE